MDHSISQDPIIHAIYGGIKRDIEINLEHGCIRSALILIYCGVDAIAYLNLPLNRDEVRGNDFIQWAKRYIRFPGVHQLTGEEIYAGRCSLVHTYGATSKHVRNDTCRLIMPVTETNIAVQPMPAHPNIVMFSVVALKEAFFQGIDTYLVDMFADVEKRQRIEARLPDLFLAFPINEDMQQAMGI